MKGTLSPRRLCAGTAKILLLRKVYSAKLAQSAHSGMLFLRGRDPVLR